MLLPNIGFAIVVVNNFQTGFCGGVIFFCFLEFNAMRFHFFGCLRLSNNAFICL